MFPSHLVHKGTGVNSVNKAVLLVPVPIHEGEAAFIPTRGPEIIWLIWGWPSSYLALSSLNRYGTMKSSIQFKRSIVEEHAGKIFAKQGSGRLDRQLDH